MSVHVRHPLRCHPLTLHSKLALFSLCVLGALALRGAAPSEAPASSGCPDADLAPSPQTLDRVEQAMLCVINVQRDRYGLTRLRRNSELNWSSKFHSGDMVTHRYFAHHAEGRWTLWERIEAGGYFKQARRGLYAENIGIGALENASARVLVRAWMRSSRHRVNILDGRLRDIGIGAKISGPDPAFYPEHDSALYTTNFGVRKSTTTSSPSSPSGSDKLEVRSLSQDRRRAAVRYAVSTCLSRARRARSMGIRVTRPPLLRCARYEYRRAMRALNG